MADFCKACNKSALGNESEEVTHARGCRTPAFKQLLDSATAENCAHKAATSKAGLSFLTVNVSIIYSNMAIDWAEVRLLMILRRSLGFCVRRGRGGH